MVIEGVNCDTWLLNQSPPARHVKDKYTGQGSQGADTHTVASCDIDLTMLPAVSPTCVPPLLPLHISPARTQTCERAVQINPYAAEMNG